MHATPGIKETHHQCLKKNQNDLMHQKKEMESAQKKKYQ